MMLKMFETSGNVNQNPATDWKMKTIKHMCKRPKTYRHSLKIKKLEPKTTNMIKQL